MYTLDDFPADDNGYAQWEAARAVEMTEMATRWEQHLLRADCQYYARTHADTTVLLGHKSTADAQRALDDAAGGFAAMACGRGR